MSHALEIKPLLIAALIGAIAISLFDQEHSLKRRALTGVGVGLAVQFGVRIVGVS